jgi:P27 family predicted phage terminase small subunit
MPNPRPIPTSLKRARGNPGKEKLNADEPQPSLELPACPDYLSPVSKKAWEILVPELSRMGILTSIDINAFIRYCVCLSDWKASFDFLAAHGPDLVTHDANGQITGVVPYPHTKRKRESENTLLRLETEFGLTPSSRSKVHAVRAEKVDELQALISRPLRLAK